MNDSFVKGCEGYTRPEEIAALSKFLGEVKAVQEDYIEKFGLDNEPDQMLGENPNIKLDNYGSIYSADGIKPEIALGDKVDKNSQGIKPEPSLSQSRLDINPNPTEPTSLSDYLELLEGAEENNQLSNTKVKIPGTREDIGLDNTRINLSDIKEVDLDNTRVNLTDTRDANLDDTRINLTNIKDVDLDNTRVNLSDIKDVNLDNTRVDIDGYKDISLSDTRLGLGGVRTDAELSNEVSKLPDNFVTPSSPSEDKPDIPGEINNDNKLDIPGEINDVPLSDYLEALNPDKDIALPDVKIELKDDTKTNLDNTRIELNVADFNELSETRLDLTVPETEKLSDHIESLRVESTAELGTTLLGVPGETKDQVLGDYVEKLRPEDNTELSDVTIPLHINENNELSDKIINLNPPKTELNLDETRINIKDDKENKLSETRIGLEVAEDTELSQTRLDLHDTSNVKELSDHIESLRNVDDKDELSQTVIGLDVEENISLSDTILHKPGEEQENKLPETRIDLDEVPEVELGDHIEELKGGEFQEPKLEEKVEKLNGIPDNKLGEDKLNIPGEIKEVDLNDIKLNITPKEVELSNVRLDISPASIESLPDTRLDITPEEVTSLNSTRVELGGELPSPELSEVVLGIDGTLPENKLEDKVLNISPEGVNSLPDTRLDITPKEVELDQTRLDISPEEVELPDVRLDITPKDVELQDVRLDITPKEVELPNVRLDISPEDVNTLPNTRLDIAPKDVELDQARLQLNPSPSDVELPEAVLGIETEDIPLSDTILELSPDKNDSTRKTDTELNDRKIEHELPGTLREEELENYVDPRPSSFQEDDSEKVFNERKVKYNIPEEIKEPSLTTYIDELARDSNSSEAKTDETFEDRRILSVPGTLREEELENYVDPRPIDPDPNHNIESLEDSILQQPENTNEEVEELNDVILERPREEGERNFEQESESRFNNNSAVLLHADENDNVARAKLMVLDSLNNTSDDELFNTVIGLTYQTDGSRSDFDKKIGGLITSYLSSPILSEDRSIEFQDRFAKAFNLPDYVNSNGRNWIRDTAEKAKKLGSSPQSRRELLETTLWLLLSARDAATEIMGVSKSSLPGGASQAMVNASQALLGEKTVGEAIGSSLKSAATSALKTGVSSLLGGSPSHPNPQNYPEVQRIGGVISTGIIETKGWENGNMRPFSPGEGMGGGFMNALKSVGQQLLKSVAGDLLTSRPYKFKKHYLSSSGIKKTLKDLCFNYNPGSVEELQECLRLSPYITTPTKFGSVKDKYSAMTLDSNAYWEVVLEPFVNNKMNGGFSYLPSIQEFNKKNIEEHGVNTGYDIWIPINGFDLQKSKTISKTLDLYDGEISYPVSSELNNELKLTIVDDQYKTWKRYFETCAQVAVYNSTPHQIGYYSSTGLMIETTNVDKTNICVALYKNVTFRCRIYIMTPQFSTVRYYDLLVVLKDYAEEYSGEVDSGGTDLNVNFSIVGQNPVSNAVSVSNKQNKKIGFVANMAEYKVKKVTSAIQKKATTLISIL